MHPLALFFLLSAAVSQAAWILSDSKVMEPLRTWIFRQIEPAKRCRCSWQLGVIIVEDAVVWQWFYNGLSCALCTGVWFALLAASILRPDFLPGGVFISVPVYALGLALMARAVHLVIERLRIMEQIGEES